MDNAFIIVQYWVEITGSLLKIDNTIYPEKIVKKNKKIIECVLKFNHLFINLINSTITIATIMIGTTASKVTVAGKLALYVELEVTNTPEARRLGNTANRIMPAITRKIIPIITSSKSISYISLEWYV